MVWKSQVPQINLNHSFCCSFVLITVIIITFCLRQTTVIRLLLLSIFQKLTVRMCKIKFWWDGLDLEVEVKYEILNFLQLKNNLTASKKEEMDLKKVAGCIFESKCAPTIGILVIHPTVTILHVNLFKLMDIKSSCVLCSQIQHYIYIYIKEALLQGQ